MPFAFDRERYEGMDPRVHLERRRRAKLAVSTLARLIAACAAFLALLTDTAVSGDVKSETTCKRKLSAIGTPNRIKSIAQFNALRAWTEATKKYGDSYAQWHNAQGGTIKCDRLPRSDYFRCTAAANPCLPMVKPP